MAARLMGYVSASNTPTIVGQIGTYGVATGGTSSSITDSGQNYTLLTFTTDGTLTATSAGLFDCLLVAGGGGGGAQGGNYGNGGGGGGGGVFRTTVYLDATSYAVTVGAGGTANTSKGGNSSIAVTSTLSSIGGLAASGGGMTRQTISGLASETSGGCGAGAGISYTAPAAGTGITGQGFNGGAAASAGGYSGGGGGGGGAGAVGGNASGSTAGNGGAGKDVSTFLGQSAGTTYKGGGGGGGGTGANGSAGSGNGAANSGGGGRGSGNNTSATSVNNGYSGVVYVRFKV